MNKKILYGIFFISIFLLSTASMVQPVRGYEFGVPKEAIGVEVEGEIKIYDEDEWEDHIGKGTDPDDIFDEDHDPDVVGAKTKTITREIETDEELIDYTYVHRGLARLHRRRNQDGNIGGGNNDCHCGSSEAPGSRDV